MSDKDDQDWLDLLAGQSVPNADPNTVRDAQIFRGALLAHAGRLENDSEIPYPHLWKNILKKISPPIQIPIPLWKRIWQKLKNIPSLFPSPQMVWAIPATAFVLVISVITYIVWPQNLIDTTYQTIYANKTDEMVDDLRDFKFRWEGEGDNVFAFGPKQSSKAAKAFGAGLLTGREAMLGNREIVLPPLLLPPATSWLKTPWANYFELGHWTILLWTASQFQRDIPETFWQEQREIFSQFKATFVVLAKTDNEAQKVLSQLKKKIEPHLEKLPTPDNPKIYKDLGFNLKKMMNFLAPRSIVNSE